MKPFTVTHCESVKVIIDNAGIWLNFYCYANKILQNKNCNAPLNETKMPDREKSENKC